MKTAMYAAHDEANLDSSLVAAFFDKQIEVSRTTVDGCKLYFPRTLLSSIEHNAFLESQRALPDLAASHAWRESLLQEMSTSARTQQEFIVKKVGDICLDLEARCDHAERPFREEQAKSRDLAQRLRESEEKSAMLLNEASERMQLMGALEAENTRLLMEADLADQKHRNLTIANELLGKELERAQQEASQAATAAQEAVKQGELSCLAIVTGKDEVIEVQAAKLADHEAQIKTLRNEIVQSQLQNSNSEDRVKHLEGLINSMNKELETTKLLIISKQTEADNSISDLRARAELEKQNLDLEVFRLFLVHQKSEQSF